MEFPKNIYQCWIQGKEKITNKSYIENVKNWKLLNPEWNHTVIDNEYIRNACAEYSPECIDTYDSFEIMHLKIDFGRYVVLYLNGGIYCDMDMYVIRSLDNSEIISNFINKYNTDTHILGLSSLFVDWYEKYILFKGNEYICNNAIMISSPKNPMLKEFINSIINTVKKSNDSDKEGSLNSIYKIQMTTGPIAFNNFFQNKIKNQNENELIEIFPPYIFEPGEPFGLFDIKNETISIHKMEMTWFTDDLKLIVQYYYKLKPYLYIFLAVIILLLLYKLDYFEIKINI